MKLENINKAVELQKKHNDLTTYHNMLESSNNNLKTHIELRSFILNNVDLIINADDDDSTIVELKNTIKKNIKNKIKDIEDQIKLLD